MIKVMTIIGTRPEAIKMAPILRQMARDPNIQSILVNTGQHRQMIDQVFEVFSIYPDYDLALMKENQELSNLSSDIIVGTYKIIKKEQPSIVLVHGDTTTAFAAAYASFIHQIPIAHVEAGLRTYNRYSPFPEEMNRTLVSQLADYHFACTEDNKENLLKENISSKNILVTGNTVIDAVQEIVQRDFQPSPSLKYLFDIKGKIILITTHRRENLQVLKGIYQALNQLVQEHEDIQIIFPVHKNPLVKSQVQSYLMKHERIHILEPLEYMIFCHLMKRSYLILTDSGGIQEEACALRIPCLVTRESTERPEGIKSSAIKLVGTSTDNIYDEIHRLLSEPIEYKKMVNANNPFGDGKASKRIVEFLKNTFK